ncbi:SusC/RagA family TonB-linked outer membrane protein [Sinomicrobium weinanense]|uniref:SusC/RagA family TonB-linked outer membrane protein n=1 Tax=Sinomicrobium weinanense TaxID=2842200 RepID=A0A926Q565_9FLAO|nr:SusC/RagA family TonB-linked outer membrane protein [Sinomicrobium weinanense]MBC9797635.1 SusC/RagA family TonB-linked outer membrane protein [Sinomicrobium weinanense]MBU3125255.1 SusC/RagA family TonB-linked outer membrane protein [Sinomicrobium weinanense]
MRTKFSRLLTLLLAFVVHLSFAQEKTITGTVTDQNGMPLPGVNILVKESTTGTQTDFDGNYSIQASTGQVLVYSYIGMTNVERTIGAENTINVQMAESAEALEEVVVTALGIKREEKALGYAVQGISGDGLTEARESNISNAISGKVAGVQVTGTSGSVGASSRIVLRGNSSITGNNEPLYVVDGVPIDNRSFGDAGSTGGVDLPNGAADINPDDIESVSVLKGPNAAALYGLRAGNGVIVITTKRGSEGKKFEVSLNTNVTFSNPLILPDYQNSYGQGGDPSGFEFVDGAGGGIGDGVDESWGAPLDVGLEFIQWNSQLINDGKPLPWVSYPDNVKDFLDTGINISNNLSLTKGNMRLSIGNSDEQGMIPFTELKKLTIGFNGSMDLGERFTASLSANYFNIDSDNLPISGYNNENPFQQFIWSARNVNFADLRDWRNFPLAPDHTAAAGTPLNWNHNFQNNPYWVLETNRNTLEKDRLVGNVNLSYQLNDWLSLSTTLGTDFYSQLETSRQAMGSNNAPDGSYTEIQRRFEEINASVLLSMEKDISEDISISFNVGGNHMNRKYHSTFGSLPALELPDLYNLSNLQTGATATVNNTNRNQKINSLYGYGQIAYKNFFFIDFTGRNDWASILPKKNNSFFYPSISTSIVLSDIFNLGESVNFLKLRGGWSKVGSTGALSPYNINPTFSLNNTGFGNQGQVPNTLFNPNLKAETVTGIEVGLDAKFFQNRLRLNATYYDQQSEDLLVPIQVSSSTGYRNVWDNIADMSNKGVEIQLGGTIVRTEDFSFDIDLNWAKNDNQVTSLGELDSYVLGGQWGVTLEARADHPYGVLVGRDFERTDDGQVIYQDGLPLIDQTPKVLGDIAPDWTGGANFSIRYKNLDFSTLIDAKIGGDIHSMTYAWGRYAGTLEESLIGREGGVVGNGVKSDGNGGYVPNDVISPAKSFNQASYSNSIESSAIFDASYVKLRQVTLGYSIPSRLLENTPIQSLKFSVVGRNLALLYKKAPHIDPETGFSSANGEQGQEFGQYPSARNIGFNINLKF